MNHLMKQMERGITEKRQEYKINQKEFISLLQVALSFSDEHPGSKYAIKQIINGATGKESKYLVTKKAMKEAYRPINEVSTMMKPFMRKFTHAELAEMVDDFHFDQDWFNDLKIKTAKLHGMTIDEANANLELCLIMSDE